MKTKPTSAILFFSLFALGCWGVWKIVVANNQSSQASSAANQSKVESHNSTSLASTIEKVSDENEQDIFVELNVKIKALLRSDQSGQAIALVNDEYSQLSAEQITAFKEIFIRQGVRYTDNGEYQKAQRLYNQLTTLIEDVDVLDLLSSSSAQLSDWRGALDALLRSSILENRQDYLIQKRLSIVSIAAQLKQEHLSSNDYVSVRQLYQRLYEAHPDYAFFQFELALAQLSLGDKNSAKNLLSSIQYDLEIGPAAKQQLAKLELEEHKEQQIAEQKTQALKQSKGIAIPLTRVGNSFLVDSRINGFQTRLLLDTGASITALSPETIRRLNLESTGRTIRLSTANGIAESSLYLAKRIQLGRVTAKDLIIAEVELGNSDQFKGLLGTDLLNQISNDYVIDNKNNTLIFKANSR